MRVHLRDRIKNSAFAFRGYNVTNLGKSPELLEHPDYGPIFEETLRRAEAIYAKTINLNVDLVGRIRSRRESTLATFPEDVAMIVGVEMAQLKLLEHFFAVPVRDARLSIGYSIGEVSALILGEVFSMENLLPVPLALAADCADLATNVTMGILFTRGPILELDAVRRVCAIVSSEGEGIIAPSTQLAPNTVLVLGENNTVDRFHRLMREHFADKVILRRNKEKWPPLHTPILWRHNVPSRSALSLTPIPGGFRKPAPPIASCVTGKFSYNDFNAREHLVRWVDQPQLLWDALYETVNTGVELIIHVGPEPNLIPSTFERLSTNIRGQLGGGFLNGWGHRVISSMARNAWLKNVLPSKAALLRIPFIEHIVLEDWLLAQKTRS